MRYAIIHCTNPTCAQRVWVPADRLGLKGQCPDCGLPMHTPAAVPDEDLIEGPHIMRDFEAEQLLPVG